MNDPYTRIPKQQLRAKGNLSYLDFIRLVKKLWEDAHPDIKLQPTADKSFPKYPVITYRLDFRKAHPNEPKPRYREEMPTGANEDAILILGQRFQNLVTFTALDETDPHTTEALIEVFEDFMMEFQPVFKELGASELVYARRIPDSHDTRPGEGINSRSVSYLLTTEKIIKTSVSKIDEVIIDARLYLSKERVTFTADPDDGSITVSGVTLRVGDWVLLSIAPNEDLPDGLNPGYYVVNNILLVGNDRKYFLAVYDRAAATPGYSNIEASSEGTGLLQVIPDYEITMQIVDDFHQL